SDATSKGAGTGKEEAAPTAAAGRCSGMRIEARRFDENGSDGLRSSSSSSDESESELSDSGFTATAGGFRPPSRSLPDDWPPPPPARASAPREAAGGEGAPRRR